MTWLVIGVALALPALMYTLLANASTVAGGFGGKPGMTLFLDDAVAAQTGSGLATQLQDLPGVLSASYVSAEDALRDFETKTEFTGVLAALDVNPLPAAIVIRLEGHDVPKLRADFEARAEVDRVLVDLAWVDRLQKLVELAESIVTWMAVFFGLGVFLVTGNTIRLAIENRRMEIEVVKLVGGTDAFVRRPFLYLGLWYGLGGGLAATLLVWSSLSFLAAPIAAVMGAYGSNFAVQGLGLIGTAAVLGAGTLLGIAGAWLAVNRHLRLIEPG